MALTKMNLIITMAGRYSRFINEGYRLPKYLLPWGNKSILNEIILQLNANSDFENIYLIANKRDEIYLPHLKKITKSLGIPLENIFLISDTQGQAETANVGVKEIFNKFGKLNGNIVFHNIDTILYNRNMSVLPVFLEKNYGYIDIFESNNHAYSYILLEEGNVKSIAEKIVISNNATSGLYAFRDVNVFNDFYENNMVYITDIYKGMIEKNINIVTSEVYSEEDTIVLGTPSEYLDKAYILDS